MNSELLNKAKELTKKLVEEIGTQNDCDEAEEIRSELDIIWYKLSDEETNELGKFSVSLNDKSPPYNNNQPTNKENDE